MRLDIRYLLRFTYPEPVRESHNLLRACPTTDHRQRLLSYQVAVEPHARILSYEDYWGTRVDAFSIRAAHRELTVIADAAVETLPGQEPSSDEALEWYRSPEVRDRHSEYLRPSPHVQWNRRIEALASEVIAGNRKALGAALVVHETVAKRMEYTPGATYVGMSVADILDAKQGVCQDYAHLAIAMYRSQGVPARYVSGYFFAAGDHSGAEPDRPEIVVRTHAWVEVLAPHGDWWSFDPTNRQLVGERHVKIAHGRDYTDVMPLRGLYHGVEEHDLDVSVWMADEAQLPPVVLRQQTAAQQQ